MVTVVRQQLFQGMLCRTVAFASILLVSLLPLGVEIICIVDSDLFLAGPFNNAPAHITGLSACGLDQQLSVPGMYQYCSSKTLAAALPLSPGTASSYRTIEDVGDALDSRLLAFTG